MRDKVRLSQGNVAWKSPAQKLCRDFEYRDGAAHFGGKREKAFWMKSRMNSVESGAVYSAPL